MSIAIVGCGNIAAKHVEAYGGRQEAVDVAAVVDVDPERAGSFASAHGIARSFGSVEDLLTAFDQGDVVLDALHVCTPNAYHDEVAIAGLEAGLDVVVEKPVSNTLEGARRIQSAAVRAGRRVMVGFHLRKMHPYVDRFLDEGRLGTIYLVEAEWVRRDLVPDWGVYTKREIQGGGAMIDIGVHVLDLAWKYMGRPKPLFVTGRSRDQSGLGVEDHGTATIQFADGELRVRAAWKAPGEATERAGIRVFGTRGRLYVPAIDPDALVAALSIQEGDDDSQPPFADATPRSIGGCYEAEADDAIAMIRDEVEPDASLADGVTVQQILDAYSRSAEQGGRQVEPA